MADRWDRFFTWVWRLDGLLLLALALAGVVATAAAVFDLAVFHARDRPAEQLQQVAGANLDAKGLRLGEFQEIDGTSFLYAPLGPLSKYLGSGSSGVLGAARNLLFFDMRTQKAHWLLPDNGRTIQSYAFLKDPPRLDYGCQGRAGCRREQVAVAILLELDEARAGAAEAGRSTTLAIATADGRELTPIATSTGGMLGYNQPGGDSAFVFYVSGGAARVLELDPKARKVRSDRILSAQE